MKVIIIGGMASGPKTAARLRRLMPDTEITIVEQEKIISFGSCGMPFFLGNQVQEFKSLYATIYGVVRDEDFFRTRKDVQVLTGTKAVAIDRENKKVKVLRMDTQQSYVLDYDYLVLTTGAKAVRPPIPGVDLSGVFYLHQPDDALRLQNYLHNKKTNHVTVVGAGVIGMEVADALAGRRIKVTVCEAQKQVLPKLLEPDIARLVAGQMKRRKVDLKLACQVQTINAGPDGAVQSVTTSAGDIPTGAVVVAVGVRPNVDLAREAGLEIGVAGAIKVDTHMRTSDPYIFAAGDCASQLHVVSGQEVYIPLASTANKQGRVIADNIAGLDTKFMAVSGTTVLQPFELNIGRTGLGEREAVDAGYDVITGIVSGHDAPHYYPLHGSLTIELIADNKTGRLLGAQVCGQGEAIKRLDVLGTAIRLGASLKDIANLDLGYAPPYSEAIDVAVHAANALENKRQGLARGQSPLTVEQWKKSDISVCFLDIREPNEVESKRLIEQDVLTIPLGELREKYTEIPRDRPVVVICGQGTRSYEAVCFLQSVGLKNTFYLEGGLLTWLL